MNVFFSFYHRFLHKKFVVFFLCLACVILLSACAKPIDYFSYVSELRNNVFLYEDDVLSLRVYSITRESPYLSDGIVGEQTTRTEIRLLAPQSEHAYHVFFNVNGEEYGGEASFDNVKTEHYYACPIDVSTQTQLQIRITCGETTYTCTVKSVLGSDTLTPKQLLQTLIAAETQLFQDMTDKFGFAGEIYMRLLFEDTPYYYVGVTDRNGKTTAFLMNATTGKILAKRQT